MVPPTLRDAVASTPATRDRYVDFLRAVSILVVVTGHWLIAVVIWEDGTYRIANLLAVVPGVQLATWLLQVLPLFFFVGGVVNRAALLAARRRAQAWPDFLSSRVVRLALPALPLAAAWLVAGPILRATDVPTAALDKALFVTAQPVWFLAVYLLVVVLAPAALAAHERWGWRAAAALAVAATAIDLLAGLVPLVGWLDYAVVFLFAHQLGFFYGDGTLLHWSKRRLAAVALGALGTLALLTAGPYPLSMVGVTGDERSNMSPPTVCILVLTVWLVALALLLRPTVTSVLARRRMWTVVVAVNSSIMTVFLWHLTATVIVAGIVVPLGFPQPGVGSGAWWALRLPWLALLAAVLAVLVLAASPVEHHRPAIAPATALGAVSAALLGAAGFAGLALEGFGSWVAWPAVAAVTLAAVLPTRWAHHQRASRTGTEPSRPAEGPR